MPHPALDRLRCLAPLAALTSVALGTETDGSVVCPSGQCGVAGIKPTVWLTWMENGEPQSEVSHNYSLEIKTELETNGVIAGSLSLSSEGGRAVSLKGNFTAKVE